MSKSIFEKSSSIYMNWLRPKRAETMIDFWSFSCTKVKQNLHLGFKKEIGAPLILKQYSKNSLLKVDIAELTFKAGSKKLFLIPHSLITLSGYEVLILDDAVIDRLNLDSWPTTRSSLRLVSVLLGHPPAQMKCCYRMIRLKVALTFADMDSSFKSISINKVWNCVVQ